LERPEYRTDPALKAPMEKVKKHFFPEGALEDDEFFRKALAEDDFRNLTEGLEDFALEIKNTRFEFSIHEETKRVIVRIYDKNTNELISEIPPEKFLDLIANIWKQVGLIIDKRV
jgi:flagellar protein FlaG